MNQARKQPLTQENIRKVLENQIASYARAITRHVQNKEFKAAASEGKILEGIAHAVFIIDLQLEDAK